MRLILTYLHPHLRRLTGGVSCKFIGTVLELCIPYILSYIIDSVVAQQSVPLLLRWGGLMLLCSLLALVCNVVANRVAALVSRDATETLRHDLFKKITLLPSRTIDRLTIPSLISRMTTDTYYIYRMIGMIQRIGIRAPILLIGGIVMTLLQDATLASMLVAMLPFMALIVWFISKKGVPLYAKLQQTVDNLTRIVRENASGIRIIKALSKTKDEQKRFAAVNEQVASDETKAASVMAINSPTMRLLLNIGLVLVVVVGARRVNDGLAKPGTIIAFIQYFTIILNAMMTITRVLTMYSKALASARRVDEVLNCAEEEEKVLPEQTSSQKTAPHIEFRDVTFSYNGKVPNVQHVSFSLSRGQSLGILGPTGAGKSTLILLLLRFYQPDSGKILLNGQDIAAMPLSQLRTRFGVIFQNDTLFRGTIGDNVRLGREISMQEVDKAIKSAQGAEFVREKGGLDAAVETRGMNFSGGQQQRILIARALAGHPEVLLMDDSSSALDFKTEAALRREMNAQHGEATDIIIAQRISAIMHCDKILVLEDGVVQGCGTHEELLSSCALYKEIASLQLGGEV